MTKEYKGVPEELWVRVSRKRSDDNYGSYGVEAELKINLANVKDLNMDDTFAAVDAWLTAAVAGSMTQKGIGASVALVPEVAIPEDKSPPPPLSEAPPVARLAQVAASVPPSPPEASVSDSATETHEVLDNCTISHQVTGSGIHHLLVKGGKFSKFGVKLWPEKASEFIESDFTQWDIGKEYSLPDGYTEAVVQMKPDGKPDRIVGLR